MSTADKLPPKITQNRYVLALMGVPLWVEKYPKIQGDEQTHEKTWERSIATLPAPADRLHANPRLDHLLPVTPDVSQAANGKHEKAGKTDQNNDNSNDDNEKLIEQTSQGQASFAVHKVKNISHNESSQQMADEAANSPPEQFEQTKQMDRLAQVQLSQNDKPTNPHRPSPIASEPKICFWLQGVRFGRWVLMADILLMNPEGRSIWQSLINALNAQSAQQSLTFFYREIRYPLVKNEFRLDEGLNPAQYTFDGFMMGFSAIGLHAHMNSSSVLQVAFLTDVPAGIVTQTLAQLPTVSQMAADTSLKKMLWQHVLNQP